jgi:hypothetical protein
MILAVILTWKKCRKNSEWVERSEQEALNEKWKRKLILFRKKKTKKKANGAKKLSKANSEFEDNLAKKLNCWSFLKSNILI